MGCIVVHHEAAVAPERERKAGSLLDVLALAFVAAEARFYVLTQASNRTLVLDELRRTWKDVFCGNCTVMVDLSHEDW